MISHNKTITYDAANSTSTHITDSIAQSKTNYCSIGFPRYVITSKNRTNVGIAAIYYGTRSTVKAFHPNPLVVRMKTTIDTILHNNGFIWQCYIDSRLNGSKRRPPRKPIIPVIAIHPIDVECIIGINSGDHNVRLDVQ